MLAPPLAIYICRKYQINIIICPRLTNIHYSKVGKLTQTVSLLSYRHYLKREAEVRGRTVSLLLFRSQMVVQGFTAALDTAVTSAATTSVPTCYG